MTVKLSAKRYFYGDDVTHELNIEPFNVLRQKWPPTIEWLQFDNCFCTLTILIGFTHNSPFLLLFSF